MDNVIKCAYCDRKYARFKGKKAGHGKLWYHVLMEHWCVYKKSIGFAGNLMDYLDMLDSRDEEDELEYKREIYG